jgi:hypothetical protein
MDQVQKIIEPFTDDIWSMFDDAFEEWKRVSTARSEGSLSRHLYSRTKANDIFDAVARSAMKRFADVASVHVFDQPTSFKLLMHGEVLVRFKKSGENGVGQNIETQAELNFCNPQSELPGLPPEASKVEIVYHEHPLGTHAERLVVVCREGKNVLWDYELLRPESKESIVPMPLPDLDDDDTPLVKPKIAPAAKVQ